MNKREQAAVTRALAHVATSPDVVARELASLHRAALSHRAKHELENLIQEHKLWGHLTRVNGALVPLDEAQPASNWPFPKASAAAASPPSALDRADVATF